MKFSYSMIAPLVRVDKPVEEIADDLTNKVCEVEEVIVRAIPDDVVIGKVLEVWKHPEADKLMVTKIDCGSRGVFQICTGGENVQAHTYVPVALPGCYLPVLDLRIEPRVMRGLESNGMICSKSELGIAEDQEHHWIWTLQYASEFAEAEKKSPGDMQDITDADCGISLKTQYPWMENRILDVDNKTLTHRPDLFGHFGLANEIYTLYGAGMPADSFDGLMRTRAQLTQGSQLSYDKASVGVRLETEGVSVYHLVEIKDIVLAASDLERRVMLMDVGTSPRMNRVDLSNLFMYQTGQPIHCFDAAKISGSIVVRNAKDGEQFVDLFGKKHELTSQDMVIADDTKILALAGIVGGLESGVSDTTKDVLVEIAHFDPVQVRRTGMRLGLRTEAELRYEKHLNPAYTLGVLQVFLAYLDAAWLGRHTVAGVTTAVRDMEQIRELSAKHVDVSPQMLSMLMWGDETMMDKRDAQGILERLGCVVDARVGDIASGAKGTGDEIRHIQVPVWRSPAEFRYGEEVVEEVARIQGYDTIVPRAYTVAPMFVPYEGEIVWQRRLEQYMSGVVHADQVETYPRHEQQYLDILGVSTEQLFELENPTAPEARFMRDTMVWHLVEMVRRNATAFDACRVFDLGKTRKIGRSRAEHKMVAFALWIKIPGDRKTDLWLEGRGVVGGLLEQLVGSKSYDIQPTLESYYHPRQQGNIMFNGTSIGHLATVHPYVLDELKMSSESKLVVGEVDLTILRELLTAAGAPGGTSEQSTSDATYETLQDQIVWKDVSFALPAERTYGTVVDAVRNVEGICDVELLDLYKGDRLIAGTKSISLRLKIRGTGEGDITPEYTNSVLSAAIAAVENTGASLRK